MINQGMIILYVADQEAARAFYQAVLQLEPALQVPGMTEFRLENGLTLGLMPTAGIKRILGNDIFNDATTRSPRAELYLHVDAAENYLDRAVRYGAEPILKVGLQDWGDKVGYCLDLDRHVLAFAESPQ